VHEEIFMERFAKIWLATGATALIGAVAVAGAALADRGGHHGMREGSGIMAMMERYDANKDGNLSQEEIDTNRTQWHGEFDKDKSGDLSLAEFEALWLKARREMMVREYQEFDRDGDGKVTLDEYRAPLNMLVTQMDRNGDGVLNREDRKHRRGMEQEGGQETPGSSN
jgi:Ca2+-binding EF-hand superfamily protein